MKTERAIWLLAVLSLGVPVAQAQDGGSARVTVSTSQPTRETQPQARLVDEFSAFAGSDENAQSLVSGLRQGSVVKLSTGTTSGTGTAPGETVTFRPATRPMGYGNVRIALALAREQLAQNGVTQPTPDQIRAALAGGTIATGTGEPGTTARLPGVLEMRADGMGWGQIANSMGVKLGAVMSGRTGAQATTVSTTSAGSTTTSTRSDAGTGITTASGIAPTAAASSHGNSASTRAGAGIVTAAGGGASAGNASIGAGVRAHGGGGNISTAAGAGGGNGLGLAKGHVRN